MDATFDPYYKWLGIPPEEQPAHHYRLLGLTCFENDLDVIEGAADRQMAHVQTHKTGRYASLSQNLLNELSTAKLCLLNPGKKQQYDAQLRQKTEAASPAPPRAPEAPPVSQPAAPEPDQPMVRASANAPRRAPLGRKNTQLLIAGSVVAAGVVVVAVLYAMSGSDPQPTPTIVAQAPVEGDDKDGEANRASDRSTGAQASSQTPVDNTPTPQPKTPDPLSVGPGETQDPVLPAPIVPKPAPAKSNSAEPPTVTPPSPPSPPNVGEPSPPTQPTPDPMATTGEEPRRGIAATPPNDATTTAATSTPTPPVKEAGGDPPGGNKPEGGDNKQLVPSFSDHLAAKKKIQARFQQDYATLNNGARFGRTNDQAQYALALKLYAGRNEVSNEADLHYALLMEVRDLCVAAGYPKAAVMAADELVAKFETPGVMVKADALLQSTQNAKAPDATKAAAEMALRVVNEALDAGDFEAASKALAAGDMAIKTNSQLKAYANLFAPAVQRVAFYRQLETSGQRALQTLPASPNNPAMNRAAGVYLCFVRNDWKAGLPLLENSGNPGLSAVAKRELIAKDDDDRHEVAKRWERLSLSRQEGMLRASYASRAAYWFEKVLPSLSATERRHAQQFLNARKVGQ